MAAYLPTKRLFIGLEIPESCRETLARLDPHLKGLRWVAANQLHLTMSFLGNVPAPSIESLKQALAQVSVPPFFLPIAGVGSFGGARPSVVWAGIGKGHPHLYSLHRRIQDAVLRENLEPDLKPFHPHITLARAREVAPSALKSFLRENAEAEFGLWKVNSFTLFSSTLGSEGSVYTVEQVTEF